MEKYQGDYEKSKETFRTPNIVQKETFFFNSCFEWQLLQLHIKFESILITRPMICYGQLQNFYHGHACHGSPSWHTLCPWTKVGSLISEPTLHVSSCSRLSNGWTDIFECRFEEHACHGSPSWHTLCPWTKVGSLISEPTLHVSSCSRLSNGWTDIFECRFAFVTKKY